jgi:hypothetical protein
MICEWHLVLIRNPFFVSAEVRLDVSFPVKIASLLRTMMKRSRRKQADSIIGVSKDRICDVFVRWSKVIVESNSSWVDAIEVRKRTLIVE